ncbi:uncharacterized protein [Asterias amurensis]|uniref:uncharacterized protein n=1 Tax=Asterias amurensis TaxID=7602 RepID=UPI003AB45A28
MKLWFICRYGPLSRSHLSGKHEFRQENRSECFLACGFEGGVIPGNKRHSGTLLQSRLNLFLRKQVSGPRRMPEFSPELRRLKFLQQKKKMHWINQGSHPGRGRGRGNRRQQGRGWSMRWGPRMYLALSTLETNGKEVIQGGGGGKQEAARAGLEYEIGATDVPGPVNPLDQW